jgi:hypothetical protein
VTADDFATSVDRLFNQVAHWEQARWWSGSTADLMYALIQRLSDLDSEAESMQHRVVPRLSDLTLPDQLRVLADDLLAADPPDALLTQALAEVDTFRRSLSPRR